MIKEQDEKNFFILFFNLTCIVVPISYNYSKEIYEEDVICINATGILLD